MKLSSIEETSAVYSCSNNVSISWHSIVFPEFRNFATATQRLINELGELDDDDYWLEFIKKVRKFRFEAIASPLSEEILQERLTELIESINKNQTGFERSYPDAITFYLQVLNASEALKKIFISRLLDVLNQEIIKFGKYNEMAILVCEARFRTDAGKSLAHLMSQGLVVISPAFLQEDVSFKNLFVIGPTRWFPNYIFSAPRAQNILIFKNDWIRDNFRPEPVFVMPIQQTLRNLIIKTPEEAFAHTSIDSETLRLPAFDIKRLQKLVESENRGHDDIEYVQAKFFLLEEDWGVLLEANENSSIHVIDLEDGETSVKKIKTNQIENGMFILLRNKGGGDFIVPIADQIMGKDGINAREYQLNWKMLLRKQVTRLGYAEVIRLLQSYGSPKANHMNLHNWVSERNIKTDNKNDFHAIMKLVNLHDKRELYWSEMERIDSAHRKAGHKIKLMLLNKVKNSDFRVLKRNGKISFELDTENEIGITAFQVIQVYPEKIQALPSQLGYPIKQG